MGLGTAVTLTHDALVQKITTNSRGQFCIPQLSPLRVFGLCGSFTSGSPDSSQTMQSQCCDKPLY